jgi:type I restriction enzyme, S subunit
MGGLTPYREKLESRIPWLELVPHHWQVFRAKVLFREIDERSDTGREELLSVSHLSGIRRRSELNANMFLARSNKGHKLCRPDDLVINTMWAWMGALGVSSHSGLVSPSYSVYRPRRELAFVPRYVHHLLRTPAYVVEYTHRSTGIHSSRLRLYPDQFLQIPVLLPPPGEQAAIVRFLEHASGHIDRFIRAKQKLIALLNEQKQAIIHRIMTRGLDPDVPMKDSGVPWLGEIPASWEVRKLKQCVTAVEQGWSPQCEAQPGGPDEWCVLKVGCVNGDTFATEQNKRLPSALGPRRELEIRHDDILVSRANTPELLGLAAVAEHPRPRLLLCDKLFRFRALAPYAPRFLVHALRARPSRAQIESSTNGASSSMQNIGQSVVKNLQLAAPRLEEQLRICAAIAEETGPIVRSIAQADRELTLMREYRTRLVADVVTGQLDVRAAAASLPALEPPEAHEPGAMDDPSDGEEERPS